MTLIGHVTFAMADATRMRESHIIMRGITELLKKTVTPVGLIILLWILSTLMTPKSSHATVFFDTDFETCTVGTGNDFPCEGWNDFNQERIGSQEVVSGGAFSGSKFMRHSSTGEGKTLAGNTYKPSIYANFPAMEHIFLRVAIRFSQEFQYCFNGHTKLIRFRATEGNPILWVYNRWGSYALVMEAPYDTPGTYVVQSNTAPRLGQWDQIEVEYKLNTPGQSNGYMRMWANGVLIGEQTNKAYRGPTPTTKCGNGQNDCPSTLSYASAQIYNQCMIGTIDYDRVAVGNTRIGPTNSKQASVDSTPPASPQGFQVH